VGKGLRQIILARNMNRGRPGRREAEVDGEKKDRPRKLKVDHQADALYLILGEKPTSESNGGEVR